MPRRFITLNREAGEELGGEIGVTCSGGSCWLKSLLLFLDFLLIKIFLLVGVLRRLITLNRAC